jgi:hypothetical protein
MNILSHAQKAVKKYPAKVTAKEFLEMIAETPSVFEHWETPLEITEYVDCNNSKITHLSPLLTFSGKDSWNNTAVFSDCKDLQIATGTFHYFVTFRDSSITKIDQLHIQNCHDSGLSASFARCKKLRIATGTYPGNVIFYESGIHSIQNLHIQNPHSNGNYADFLDCSNLQTLEGWDLSKQIAIEPHKLEAEKKRRASLKKFIKEIQPEELPFL